MKNKKAAGCAGLLAIALFSAARAAAPPAPAEPVAAEVFQGVRILSSPGEEVYPWREKSHLQPVAPVDVRQKLQPTIDQIVAVRNSDRGVRTPASIGSRLSWNGFLFKNRFSISVGNGAVSEIKLRCNKKYVFFKYQPDVEYTVSPNAGDCTIEVVGDPGTTFELTQ